MKASITRTLQAPQYAPITMTLEEECTPEAFTATLNKLADLIENTLRERYPQYAGVLPKVEKKAATKSQPASIPASVFSDRVINIQRGKALIECINKCTSLSQLKGYESQLDSDEAENAYNEKMNQFQQKKVS